MAGEYGEVILKEFEKIKTLMCLIDAYPYKGHWYVKTVFKPFVSLNIDRCNDGWLEVWECSSKEQWVERASKTMENWSHATHSQMRQLRDRVQIRKETAMHSYHIYRNDERKLISVFQRPFDYQGETHILYELVPEAGLIKDNMKRSMEAFRYIGALVTMFDMHGNLLHQNPRSKSFYEELLASKEKGKSILERILGHRALHDKLIQTVAAKGAARVITIRRDNGIKRVIRRRLNATYGLDPVTGSRMIVLDESYAVDNPNYTGPTSFVMYDVAEPPTCPFFSDPIAALPVSEDRNTPTLPSLLACEGSFSTSKDSSSNCLSHHSMDMLVTATGEQEVTVQTQNIPETSTQPTTDSPSSTYSSVVDGFNPCDDDTIRMKKELEYYKKCCKRLVKRCHELSLLGVEDDDDFRIT